MGRAPCCEKNGLKKGPWTPEEDQKLTTYIQMHGPGNWRSLPKNAGLLRCGKSCRLRWTNYLRPDIKRGRFSFEEDERIIQLHSILGNKWSAIAARLPGRTDNEIKNHWNTHIRKRLLRNGIDPVTHAPRLDFLDLSSILSRPLCNPSLLNLSSLLRTQAALLNPDLLRLATTLASLKQGNPELVLQQLQQNKISSSLLQNFQVPSSQFNQLQNPVQETPACNASDAQFLNQAQFLPANMEGFPSTSTNLFGSCENSLENLVPTSLNDSLVSQPNYDHCSTNSTVPEIPEMSGYQDVRLETVMSPPLSSPDPLTSPSTFINSSTTEDERESYCSSLFKFEIPESLDIEDFMRILPEK